MTKTLDLQSISTDGSGITDSHFGLNFVSDYERIGTQGWEQFDNIVSRVDVNSLRYPGGTTAETLFDYRNPNRTTAVNGAGETVNMETLDEYLDFCNREGINPTIIVPTRCLLTSQIVDGHRTFDEAQINDLKFFFETTLEKVDPSLKVSFELGNEYETYMTSTEYGRVANALVEIISDAYTNTVESLADQSSPLEPDIFVQVWGYSVGGGNSYSELMSRNQQVLSQFTSENLLDVDGLVSHYYFQEGRNIGTDQAQTFLGIKNQISMISEMHRLWEIAGNHEMISRISEWNVLFRSVTNLGLQQINPMMEMFTGFVRSGFDALDFWSAQYHATSLADSSGRLMAAGTLMDVLKPAVVGTEVGTTIRDADLSAYTFMGSGRFVAVLSSTSIDSIDLGISTSLFPPGYRLVDAYSLGVDEATSDGKYRTLVGLPSYGEPDAKIVLTQLPISLINGTIASQTLDPFESLVLVFTLDIPDRPFVYGTDKADLIYGSGEATVYVGGAGVDRVSYITSLIGVCVDLSMSSTDPSNKGDVLISIEQLGGSSFNDTLLGSGEANVISGWHGDDFINGGDGADTLTGGSDNDTILGGYGSDSLNGDSEDDLLLPGGGRDTVAGGTGEDVLSFCDYDDGVTIWADVGRVETEDGIVVFREIESFVGSNFDDRFSLGSQKSTVVGLDGDDIFEIKMGGRHEIFAGDGDDLVLVYNGTAIVDAGSGDDKITSFSSGLAINGGAGDDWVLSRGNNGIFEGEEGHDIFYALGRFDRFIFSDTSEHDVIHGFRPDEDVITFRGPAGDSPWLVQTNDGTELFFDADTSVLLRDCFVGSLADLQYLVA